MASLPTIERLATGAGYTAEQVKAVPGLSNRTLAISSRATEIGSVAISQASTFLKQAMKDPVTFVKNGLYLDILNGAKINSYDGYNTAISYLKNNGVSQDEIKSLTLSTINKINEDMQREPTVKPSGFDQVIRVGTVIALTFMLPQLGESLGASLLSSGALAAGTTAATATAIGTAMASVAVQTAQGVPLEDAIKNAGVNVIVQTGATSAATQLNDVIKNPAVTDALVSAGASAVKTAAAGGSTEDIQKNVLGSFAGSVTSSATGSNLAGSTVGGAVSGGVTGALSGAASALGQDAAKPKDTTTTTTDTTKTADATKLDPVTQQLVTAIQKEQTSPTPSTELGKVAGPMTGGVISLPPGGDTGTGPKIDLPKVDVTSTPVIPPSPSNIDTLSPITITATQSGTPSLADTQQDVLETITAPKPTTPITLPVTSTYTPTITTTPSPVVTPTKTPVSVDKPILDLIASTQPTTPAVPATSAPVTSTPTPTTTPTTPTTPTTTPTTADTTPTTAGTTTPSTPADTAAPAAPTMPVTQPTSQPPTAVSEQDKKMLDLISPPSATTTETPAVPPTTPVAPVAPTPVPVTPSPVPVTPAPTPEPVKPPITPPVTPASVAPTTPSPVEPVVAPPIVEPPAPVVKTPEPPPATPSPPVISEQDKKILDLINPPSTPTTETPAVPSTAPDQVLPEVVATATQDKETTTPSTDTKTDTEAPLPVDVAKEELPPEEVAADPTKPEDKYKPNLRIYGGTTPSTLSQSLGTGGTYSTGVATTGLTGSRGAGEIESKETGKKRKNVWNEASLRLKDALGV